VAGDVDADGRPDLVAGTGPGGPPRVRVFSGDDNAVLADFAPYAESMTAGVTVALCYADDDPYADPVVGTMAGPPATVRVFSGATGDQADLPTAEFRPFGDDATGGVSVAASNDPPQPYFTLEAADGGLPMDSPVWSKRTYAPGQTAIFDFRIRHFEGGYVYSDPTPTGTVTLLLVATSELGSPSATYYTLGTADLAYQSAGWRSGNWRRGTCRGTRTPTTSWSRTAGTRPTPA
jgi:hypothetical protein